MWIGRRYRSTRNWYSSLSTVRRLLALLLFMTMAPCLCCLGGVLVRKAYVHAFVFTAEDRAFHRDRRDGRHQYQEGLPSAARKLIADMGPFDEPDAAVVAHPDWFGHRFPNGEWIFGYGHDSHGLTAAGGTLVIKDSRGRTRVFFGHVCGTNASFPWNMRYAKTLDDMEKDEYFAVTLREWKP